MAEPKQRQRPKGYEIRESLKSNKNKDRLTERDRELLKYKLTPPAAIGSGVATAEDIAGSTDPYLLRNEFKKNFYKQIDQPPITAETMYGKGTKRSLEYPIVDPDTRMMEDAQGMAEGGSVRGQKNIQVKKKAFRGVF